jgi:hypothetical protein
MFLTKWLMNTSIVPAGIMLPPLAPTAAISFPSYANAAHDKTVKLSSETWSDELISDRLSFFYALYV